MSTDGRAGDQGNEPFIYKAIGMTPAGYEAERAKMREQAKHPFREHPIKGGFTNKPLTPGCSVCSLPQEHEIHPVK